MSWWEGAGQKIRKCMYKVMGTDYTIEILFMQHQQYFSQLVGKYKGMCVYTSVHVIVVYQLRISHNIFISSNKLQPTIQRDRLILSITRRLFVKYSYIYNLQK